MNTKTRLLSYLKEEKGTWISGESLSRRIGITRSAVWKSISRLREEGYGIESSPNKGYRFLRVSEMLLPSEIGEGLDTKVLGKRDIIHYKETGSTNARAKELASRGAPEGTLVVSEAQSQGRGRKGRIWFSPPQTGIYASLILRPAMPPNEAPKITLLTAVSAAETLLHLTILDVRIKWPNDILVNGKKIAGILTEISTEMDTIDYVVVGLGMNVNNTFLPDDINETATSILIETGERFPRVEIVREYLRRQETYYRVLTTSGFEPILGRWKELANIIGRQIKVEMIDKTYVGTVEDIDPEGVLILKDMKGASHRIFSGDVTLV
ncbi:MAG: biotin--[acetyl-CoA-carboxylase] ligase [Deltaproteobacteria bacterium]|nr:biotin--[acetyl-CoA-carboxylase] ligase [Deltaproteobacteria bacterium]